MDVPSWPSGVIRFDGEILELTLGGVRVATGDIRDLTIKEPRLKRFSLGVKYQAGLSVNSDGVWVDEIHGEALTALVAAVEQARASSP